MNFLTLPSPLPPLHFLKILYILPLRSLLSLAINKLIKTFPKDISKDYFLGPYSIPFNVGRTLYFLPGFSFVKLDIKFLFLIHIKHCLKENLQSTFILFKITVRIDKVGVSESKSDASLLPFLINLVTIVFKPGHNFSKSGFLLFEITFY